MRRSLWMVFAASAASLLFSSTAFASTPLGVTQGIPSYGGYPMPQDCKSHYDPRAINGGYEKYERQNQLPCRVTTTFPIQTERDGLIARMMVLSVHPANSMVGQTAVLEATQTGNNGVQYALDASGNCSVTYGWGTFTYSYPLPATSCIDPIENPKQFITGTPVVAAAGEPVVVEWSVLPSQRYTYYTRSCTLGACFSKQKNGNITYSFKTRGENFSTGGAFTGSVTVTPSTGPTTYTLDDTAGHTISITINGTSQPTLAISANPSTVNSGATSTITWSASNVTSCSVSGPSFTTSPLRAGSQSTGPLKNSSLGPITNTYTLSCSTPQGQANASAQVTVNSQYCAPGARQPRNGTAQCNQQATTTPPVFAPAQALPIIKSFTATRVQKGTASTLSWSVGTLTPGTVCSISPADKLEGGASPGWSGPGANWISSIRTTPLSGQTLYTLSCSNTAGLVSLTAAAQVIPSFNEL